MIILRIDHFRLLRNPQIYQFKVYYFLKLKNQNVFYLLYNEFRKYFFLNYDMTIPKTANHQLLTPLYANLTSYNVVQHNMKS